MNQNQIFGEIRISVKSVYDINDLIFIYITVIRSEIVGGAGLHSTVVSILASRPSCPGSNHGSEFFPATISEIDGLIGSTLLKKWTVKSLITMANPILN